MQLTPEERELLGKLLRGTIDNASMPDATHAIAVRLLAKLNSEPAEAIHAQTSTTAPQH
jgi:hypothetical protein